MKKLFTFNIMPLPSAMLLFMVSNAFAISTLETENTQMCNLLSAKQIEKLQSSKIIHYQLNNGLRVYILENHRLPIFSLHLIFDVGASDELPGESGYAHLFEHMMFKGSANVPDGEHFAAIRSTGGNINALTDYDRTVYWTEAPQKFLDRVLWLEAERLKHLAITKSNLDNQRQAVLEEKLLRIDNVPYVKIASEFMVSAWQGSSYDHLIIGTDTEIKNATVHKVQNFFDMFYRPDNAVLILVGDIEPVNAIKKIDYYFSNLVQTKSSEQPGVVGEQKISFRGKSEIKFDQLAPFPLYALGWHTVGKENADFYAVELLADILLNHDGSRLKKTLIEEQELVFATIGFPLTFNKAGITALGMVPHSYADFAHIKTAVKKELVDIKLNGVSDDELCSAKKYRQMLIMKKLASNRHTAELIGDGVLFFDDPWYFISALDKYREVDNKKIKIIANKYFHEDWLALEIVPGPGVRLIKWLMEILPQRISKSIERQFF